MNFQNDIHIQRIKPSSTMNKTTAMQG